MQKGLVLSLSTILITMVLVLMALFYASSVQKNETNLLQSFFVEKAGFVGDDIDSDVDKILGTEVDVNRGSLTQIIFNDKMPSDINKLQLINYNSFVNQTYSGQQNADIDLHLDNLIDGKTELVFSNGLQYDYSYSSDPIINIYKAGTNSGVITYEINITINDSSTDATPWIWEDGTGDINVNLNFVDQNILNEVHHSGKLDSTITNTYTWNYSPTPGDSFSITLGEIDSNSDALRLSESIDDSGSQAAIVITATLADDSDISWSYDADLNYSQGEVKINRKIFYNRG